MKLRLVFFALFMGCTSYAQVPVPSLTVTQPNCTIPTGSIEVMAPLNSSSISPRLQDLFISEVTDQTSGALTYIELYNSTGATVNLADYKLLVYSNGNTAPTCNLTLSGSFPNNSVKIIAVGSVTNQGGIIPDLVFAACTGVNNNDNISLVSSTGTLIDTWGRTDGVAFTPSASGYVYRRNPDSVHPSTVWIATDWTASIPEDYTNVGTYIQGSYYAYSMDNGTWQTNPLFTNLSPGNHLVRAMLLNTGEQSIDVSTTLFSVQTLANISYGSSILCSNEGFRNAMLTGTGNYTGGTFVASSNGIVINSITGSINIAASVPGNYVVMYFIPSQGSCPATSTSIPITIAPVAGVQILADGTPASNVTINRGDAVALELQSADAITSAFWTPVGSINSRYSSNPIVYPDVTTVYSVQVTNPSGCSAQSSITVNVNSRPVIGTLSVSTSATTIGLFDTLTVNVNLSGANNLYRLALKLKGNANVAQYLDFDGATAGTLLGSGGDIVDTTPTVSNGIASFGISKIGNVTGFTGSGLFYSLRFKPKNILIPNGTSFCFYLDEMDTADASATASCMINSGEQCSAFSNQTNVWPGDTDNSNTVTTSDLLPLGYFYNSTGPARANANTSWTAQAATLWGYDYSTSNGSAFSVFGDANGDGIINTSDQAVIEQNMNNTHARPAGRNHANSTQNTETAGGLTITSDTTTIDGAGLPQTVTFTVNLNNTGGLNSLYGIDTKLSFDPEVFDLNTAIIDYTGSIFGNGTSDFLRIKQTSASLLSVAMTRYANAPVNGQGKLYSVRIQTKSILPQTTQTLVTALSDAANTQTGSPLSITAATAIPVSIINNLGIPETFENNFTLYPNPVKNILSVKSEETIKSIVVYNILGQLVMMQSHQENEPSVDLSELTSGIYMVEIISENNRGIFRVLKE